MTGTRYNYGGGVYGWNLARKVISRGANFISTFLLNPGLSDLTGSFRMFKREALTKLLKEVENRGYAFQTEIIVTAKFNGYSIEEVPIEFVDRVYGESKMGAGEFPRYLLTLAKLYLKF